MIRLPCVSALVTTLVLASACSGEGSSASSAGADPTAGCDGRCADAAAFLSSDEVATILAQGVHEARSRGIDATLAVVDRVGNVLGVYRMGDKRDRYTLIVSEFEGDGVIDEEKDEIFAIDAGLDGLKLPEPTPGAADGGSLGRSNLDHLAAISKAITGAYLSTEGMAFTSRTASQIVQDHFNPAEDFQPAGPLFGVQFSQLACSDFLQEANAFPADQPVSAVSPGPHHAPLGLAADPGGIPLYEGGSLVGGIGVMADSVYGLDPFVGDTDVDVDESIAVAAAFGFEAPVDRRATVTVEGKVFRYTDVDGGSLASDPRTAAALDTIDPAEGRLIAVRGYTDGQLRDGTAFGLPASGVRIADDMDYPAFLDAFVFVDEADDPRYLPRSGTDGTFVGGVPFTETEVRSVLENALAVANRSRAQIRRPLGTAARVTIAVVDTRGEVLGMVRSRDAPVFGADVALQKARTAAFLSSSDAAEFLRTPPLTDGEFFQPTDRFPQTVYLRPNQNPGLVRPVNLDISTYVDDLTAFLGTPALDGSIAFTDRAGGNLSRPFYPDGINGNPPGPLSKPPGEWSVFSTGLQLDISYNAIVQHALFAANGGESGDISDEDRVAFPPLSPERGCAGQGLNAINRPTVPEVTGVRLGNGLQIFPGSVPIYRGRQLIGAIGVSGDGVDQDDLVAFGGVHAAGLALGGAIGNAPPDMRADRLEPQGVRLRYVQCPQAPGIGSTTDNVCDGF